MRTPENGKGSSNETTGYGSSLTVLAIAAALLLACTGQWLSKVNTVVTNPYLDEVFHIRQARQYCAGNFHVWDPKITTPPGLYLLSYAAYIISGQCDITVLRLLNTVLLAGGVLISSYHAQPAAVIPNNSSHGQPSAAQAAFRRAHVALNICLFPPLFFFSALYYTDIASTVAVLLSYVLHENAWQKHRARPSMVSIVSTGIVALFFRQTNVFWVAVFPAGLALVHGLQRWQDKQSKPSVQSSSSFAVVVGNSWTHSEVYVRPTTNASFEDYIKTGLSVAIVAVANLKITITILLPYVVILIIFGLFVLWNGGVVLGDKSNHVATIHLPQMLYIWPYFAFFSFPLVYTCLLSLFPRHLLPSFVQRIIPKKRIQRPRLLLALAMICVITVIIHLNTIIHPFTLADNRHYTFYIFRYFILRHPIQKYLYAPLYFILAHCTIASLGNPRLGTSSKLDTSFGLIWFITTSLSLITAPLVEPRYFILPWVFWRLQVPSSLPFGQTYSVSSHSVTPRDVGKSAWLQSMNSHSAVEPPSRHSSSDHPTLKKTTYLGNMWALLRDHDHRLYLETAWFLTINAVTGYMFLYRGFQWPQEPGEMQRFMW